MTSETNVDNDCSWNRMFVVLPELQSDGFVDVPDCKITIGRRGPCLSSPGNILNLTQDSPTDSEAICVYYVVINDQHCIAKLNIESFSPNGESNFVGG